MQGFTLGTSLVFDCLSGDSFFNPKNLTRLISKKLADLTEPKLVLKRDDPFQTRVAIQTQATKIETPQVGKELKVLVPGYMAPVSKRKSAEPGQMTLEERLNVLGLESTNGEAVSGDLGQIPKTDNLLVLLVQGLQSNDAKMLNVRLLRNVSLAIVWLVLRLYFYFLIFIAFSTDSMCCSIKTKRSLPKLYACCPLIT